MLYLPLWIWALIAVVAVLAVVLGLALRRRVGPRLARFLLGTGIVGLVLAVVLIVNHWGFFFGEHAGQFGWGSASRAQRSFSTGAGLVVPSLVCLGLGLAGRFTRRVV